MDKRTSRGRDTHTVPSVGSQGDTGWHTNKVIAKSRRYEYLGIGIKYD